MQQAVAPRPQQRATPAGRQVVEVCGDDDAAGLRVDVVPTLLADRHHLRVQLGRQVAVDAADHAAAGLALAAHRVLRRAVYRLGHRPHPQHLLEPRHDAARHEVEEEWVAHRLAVDPPSAALAQTPPAVSSSRYVSPSRKPPAQLEGSSRHTHAERFERQ